MKCSAWKSTGNTVYLTWYHFVWSTKYRCRVLMDDIAETAKTALLDICERQGYEVRAIKVMPDHVHLFISIEPKVPLTAAAKALKGGSARTIFTRHPEIRKRLWDGHLWNPSYLVGTAGDVSAAIIQQYIESQREGGGQDATSGQNCQDNQDNVAGRK
mgnify:CR=1 FL=1